LLAKSAVHSSVADVPPVPPTAIALTFVPALLLPIAYLAVDKSLTSVQAVPFHDSVFAEGEVGGS
jgi:hypothetical protein